MIGARKLSDWKKRIMGMESRWEEGKRADQSPHKILIHVLEPYQPKKPHSLDMIKVSKFPCHSTLNMLSIWWDTVFFLCSLAWRGLGEKEIQ